jgi:DsbC/DsbD-like thiol-disulfide interchange protein
MKRIASSCVLVCLLISLAAGQNPKPVVEARMLLGADAAHANTSVRAAVIARIASGFHLNDNRPTLNYLIPTELKLDVPKELSIERVVYPQGQPRRFAFSDFPLSVYEGTLDIGVVLRVGRKVVPGVYTLQGKFAYQACNDHACLPPTSVPLTLAVKVVPRAVALRTLKADDFDHIKFDRN